MSTNSVTLTAELEVIKQWLKKNTSLSKIIKIEPYLSQSKSFLKVSDTSYQDFNTSLPITSVQKAAALSGSFFFESIILVFIPYIMRVFSSFDMSVIQIDIWNSQRDFKGKTLINHLFNIG